MYYKNFSSESNEPPINSEIIEPISQEDKIQPTLPHEQKNFPPSLQYPTNKFPLWLLLLFLGFLGIIGIVFFLKINKKYSPKQHKSLSFGYNFY